MRFSVVMPTYKVKKEYLILAVKSVLEQTYTDWELIIVDDNLSKSDWKCATYEVEKLMSNITNIKFIYHKTNEGANVARNTGIRYSQGEYIAFLDSDDTWDRDYLECVNRKIKKNEWDIVSCNYRLVTPQGIYINPYTTKREGFIYYDLIFKDIVGPTSAVVVRKQCLVEAGGFDCSLPARQDYDMWLRICKTGSFGYIKEAKLSLLRVGQDSITLRGNNHVKGTEMVLKKLLDNKELKPFAKQLKCVHYTEAGMFSLSVNAYKLARYYFKIALKEGIKKNAIYGYILSYFPKVHQKMRKVYKINMIKKYNKGNKDY